MILVIMALVIGCFNAAFIVPDLIYASQGSTCVTTIPDGFSFTLGTWLEVDAYTRISIVALFLLVALASCCSESAAAKGLLIALCILVFYSLFAMSWTIVGSVMFWGKLNPAGVCTGPVQAYVYHHLCGSLLQLPLQCQI